MIRKPETTVIRTKSKVLYMYQSCCSPSTYTRKSLSVTEYRKLNLKKKKIEIKYTYLNFALSARRTRVTSKQWGSKSRQRLLSLVKRSGNSKQRKGHLPLVTRGRDNDQLKRRMNHWDFGGTARRGPRVFGGRSKHAASKIVLASWAAGTRTISAPV